MPPQLCKAGGGGGAWNSEQKRNFSFAERTERLVSFFRMRVYFDDTGIAWPLERFQGFDMPVFEMAEQE